MMEEGELSNELYIIVEGEVSVFQEVNGEIKKIAEHKATTMIGEMAQFDGLPRSATVITNTPIKALVFKPENFKLFPNPSNGNFSVRMNQNDKLMKAEAIGSDGKTIELKAIQNENVVKFSNDLRTGIYVLKLVNQDGKISLGRISIQ
jgi:hypothetical protein